MSPDGVVVPSELLFSLRRLADEFGMSRETVTRRIRDANVAHAGVRDGHPVYRIGEAVQALFALDPVTDPNELSPEKRNAWYQSEVHRTRLQARCANLIRADAAVSEVQRMAAQLSSFLDGLGDGLVAEVEMTLEQQNEMRAAIATFRKRFVHAELPGVDS